MTAQEFVGIVMPDLTPLGFTATLCSRIADPPKGLPVPVGASLFMGAIPIRTRTAEVRVRVLLIEPANRARPFVYVDVDRDGVLETAERFQFGRAREPNVRGQVRLQLRTDTGSAFAQLPMDVALPGADWPSRISSDERYLLHSYSFLVSSRVRVGGQRWVFRHTISLDALVSPDALRADLTTGFQAIDTGRLARLDTFSPHMGWARGAPLVFRIGERYVSVSDLDLTERRIVVDTRAASDYRRLEIRRGLEVPDFPFVDIDGRPRRLSEWKGRFVFLNFWYQGCSPCTDEFPFIREAVRRFSRRGLIVLGLNEYGEADVTRTATGTSDAAWIEATPQSVRAIIRDWFGIGVTPSQILLGPDGRVLEFGVGKDGKPTLRGSQLLDALERRLPAER